MTTNNTATNWKPDFTQPNPYADMPAAYAALVSQAFVPTTDNTLSPVQQAAAKGQIPAIYAATPGQAAAQAAAAKSSVYTADQQAAKTSQSPASGQAVSASQAASSKSSPASVYANADETAPPAAPPAPPTSLGTLTDTEQRVWNTVVTGQGPKAATQAVINLRATNAGIAAMKSGQAKSVSISPTGDVTTVTATGNTNTGKASASSSGVDTSVPVPKVTPVAAGDNYYEWTSNGKASDVTVNQWNSWTPQQQFTYLQSIGQIDAKSTLVINKDGTWGYTQPSNAGAIISTVPSSTVLAKYTDNNGNIDIGKALVGGVTVDYIIQHTSANLSDIKKAQTNNKVNSVLTPNKDGTYNTSDINAAITSGKLTQADVNAVFGIQPAQTQSVTISGVNFNAAGTQSMGSIPAALKNNPANNIPANATITGFDAKTGTVTYTVPITSVPGYIADHQSNGGVAAESGAIVPVMTPAQAAALLKSQAASAQVTNAKPTKTGINISISSIAGNLENAGKDIVSYLKNYNATHSGIAKVVTVNGKQTVVRTAPEAGLPTIGGSLGEQLTTEGEIEASSGGAATPIVILAVLASVGIAAYSQRQNIENAITHYQQTHNGQVPTADQITLTDSTGNTATLAQVAHVVQSTSAPPKSIPESIPLNSGLKLIPESIPAASGIKSQQESMQAQSIKMPSTETFPSKSNIKPVQESFPVGVQAPANGPVNTPPVSQPAQEPQTDAGKQLQQEIQAQQALENSTDARSTQQALQNIGNAIDELERKEQAENANPKTEEGKKIKSEVQTKQALDNSVNLRAQRIALQNIASSMDAQERAAAAQNAIPKTEAGKQIKSEVQARLAYENSVSARNQRIALQNINSAIDAMERAEKAKAAIPTTQGGQQIKAEEQARMALENSVSARNQRIAMENISQAIDALERAERIERSIPKTEAGKQIQSEIQVKQALENSVNLRNQRIALEVIDQSIRKQEYADTLENANPKTEAGRQIKAEYLQRMKEEYVINEIVRHWSDESSGEGGAGTAGVLLATTTGTGTSTSAARRAVAGQIAHDIVLAAAARPPVATPSNGRYIAALTAATVAAMDAQRLKLTQLQTAAAINKTLVSSQLIQTQPAVQIITQTAQQIATQQAVKAGLQTATQQAVKEAIQTQTQEQVQEQTQEQTQEKVQEQSKEQERETDRSTDTVTKTATNEAVKENEQTLENTQAKALAPPLVLPPNGKQKVTRIPKNAAGVVTWNEGVVWWTRWYPYRQQDSLATKNKPQGAVQVANAKGAYDTIQTLTGMPPDKVPLFHMGFEEVGIRRPPHEPVIQNRASISFQRNLQAKGKRPLYPNDLGAGVVETRTKQGRIRHLRLS